MITDLRGRIDEADRTLLRGWAFDSVRPLHPVSLLVTIDGGLLGRTIANLYRPDLRDAGIGDGRHGFELRFAEPLSPLSVHQLRVTREWDGAELQLSPWILQPATRFDPPAIRHLENMLADGIDDDPAELDRRLRFLLAQFDRLAGLRASIDDTIFGWRAVRQKPPSIASSCNVSRPLALVIDEVIPDGRRDAGSVAILSHISSLQRLGYQVLFAAADYCNADDLASILSSRGIIVCGVPYYASIEEVLKRHGSSLALVYMHRVSIGTRYSRLVRHHAPHARLLLSVADLQHLRLLRQGRYERRQELLVAARQTQAQELDAMLQADAVLTHSDVEAALITRVLPDKPVHRILWTVPLRPVSTPFVLRVGVAFLADYAHAPNLDAAHRLVREIMPLIWEHEPDMPCLIAGSRLPPNLIPTSNPRLISVGHMPDLSALFERVRLTVAPLAFGAGVKGKVLDSMAAGVPCVCSPIAVEGLNLPKSLEELVADDTHNLARLILSLHRDPLLNARLSSISLSWARTELSETHLDAAMQEAIKLSPASTQDSPPGRGC